MELGVEPPDREKNQSTQKVQQYAVRLKVSLLPLHKQDHYTLGPRLCFFMLIVLPSAGYMLSTLMPFSSISLHNLAPTL